MPNGADPHIQRVQPLRPRGLKVLVHLDTDEEPLEVTLEALERCRLGVGDPLPASVRHHLLDTDADVRVRDAALNLISYRARTRDELRRRLRQKGFRPARIDPCLARLEEKGFIDDRAVAAAFVRDRLRHRPRGRARLADELRAKGIHRDLADAAIEQVFEDEEVTDVALALEVAEAWVSRQSADTLAALGTGAATEDRSRVRRRLHGFLARRGFRGEALSAATARVADLATG